MDDFKQNEIVYDENWQTLDSIQEPVIVSDETQNDSPNDAKSSQKRNVEKHRKFVGLITIQLVVCIIIAFIIFLLKAMDSTTYKRLCDYYHSMMKNTLVSNESFESIDLSPYFSASTDEIVSTVDEM